MSNDLLYKQLQRDLDKIKKSGNKKPKEIDLSNPVNFVTHHVANPKDINAPPEKWFEKRDYLFDMYNDEAKRVVVVKGRQMEVSEYAVNMILYWALKKPSCTIIYAAPTLAKVSRFSKDRLKRQIMRSRDLRPLLKDADVHRIVFGDSTIYLYSAYAEMDTLRGIPADAMILDEFQDMRTEAIPVAEETLSRSDLKKMWLIGTPKEAGSKFENLWEDSNMKEWNWESKTWVPKSVENSTFYSGYHISQELAVGKWMTQADIDSKRERYPKQKFINEVLGEFYTGLGRPINPMQLYALFDPMFPHLITNKKEVLFGGVDWGVGRKAHTVFTATKPTLVEAPDLFRYDIVYMERIELTDLIQHIDRVKQLANDFHIVSLACDTGAGYLQNQELFKYLGEKMASVEYIQRPEKPYEQVVSAFGYIVKLDRTFAIDTAYDNLTKGRVKIYDYPNDDGFKGWIVDNFMAEYPELTDSGGKKVKRWVHDPEQNDDALHSFIYSMFAFEAYKNQFTLENPSDYLSFV